MADLYDIAIAQALAGGGGGGGGGDFSTATLTFVIGNGSSVSYSGALAVENEGIYATMGKDNLMGNATRDAVLYKGVGYAEIFNIAFTGSPKLEITGNYETIEAEENGGYYFIKGDCTITATK